MTCYYWVKAVNVSGAGAFSESDRGFLGVFGPLITANGPILFNAVTVVVQ